MEKYFNKDYWDCECDDDYIHPKSEKFCVKCGATQARAPDSIAREVLKKKREVEEHCKCKKPMTSTEYCENNGSLCPHCKSVDICVTDGFETQDSVTFQPVKCNRCGKCWVDLHGLVGYEECDGSVRY